ncbi:hypothetical protein FPQ18DRAFT_60400 [Pyronema domesticum]|nr:hypothetical protein FPQ18DRAFT_60400 [Pyronema domesticum]
MIDKMPTRSPDQPPLTNVLSISTAGKNRYLFHFNSYPSLAQWTASVRLCIFEHSKLQEIYTGALIAAKGKSLNGIGQITSRTAFKHEDWVRVRFGAGTPWRKCWAVVSQPNEKEVKKAKAAAKKAKNTAYQQPQVLKGDIRFYDTKKSKKTQPIATIVDAFAAYALYPSDKALIDQSTLIKLEGRIRIHGDQPTEEEGYVFIMPDLHPAVSGFETMLRFLFPTYDTFALYGRPVQLSAQKNDPASLMFAMPTNGAQGYLEVMDVVNLILTEAKTTKLESEWREKMKALTAEKMELVENRQKQRPKSQMPMSRGMFEDGSGAGNGQNPSMDQSDLPPLHVPLTPPPDTAHNRSASEATGQAKYQGKPPNGFGQYNGGSSSDNSAYGNPPPSTGISDSSDEGLFQISPAARQLQQQQQQPPLTPVPATPRSQHRPNSRPQQLPQMDIGGEDDNLFAGVVPPRGYTPQKDDRATNRDIHQHEQNQFQAPPGFALQSSQVLLRGPPPQNDSKQAHDAEYSQPPEGDYGSNLPPAPEYSEYRRSGSWHPSAPPSGSPSPNDDYNYQGFRQQQQGQAQGQQGQSQQSRPPVSASGQKPPLRVDTHSQSITRKPVMSAVTEYNTPDSLNDLAHLIDESALDKVAPIKQEADEDDDFVLDEDTLDRRSLALIQRVLSGGDSDSDYGDSPQPTPNAAGNYPNDYDDDEPDYASSVEEDIAPPPRNAEAPRAGRMKVVGVKVDPEVVVGDAHYRPGSSAQKETMDIPKIDFGTTFSHSRQLSGEIKPAAATESITARAANGGTTAAGANEANYDTRKAMSTGDLLTSRPGPGSASDSPASTNSASSAGALAKRRSVAWSPSPQVQPHTPGMTAERYVAEKAAAAAATSQQRARYAARKSSNNSRNPSTEHLPISHHAHPPRPSSRGPNSAFLPHGLMSAPDLSANLSAKEQELIARRTGSSLLHMQDQDLKRIPHKAGLVGAIESRETERRLVKESFNGAAGGRNVIPSTTVQQEINRRQREREEKERLMQLGREQAASRQGRTPSPRYSMQPAMGQQPGAQQGYFDQQQQGTQRGSVYGNTGVYELPGTRHSSYGNLNTPGDRSSSYGLQTPGFNPPADKRHSSYSQLPTPDQMTGQMNRHSSYGMPGLPGTTGGVMGNDHRHSSHGQLPGAGYSGQHSPARGTPSPQPQMGLLQQYQQQQDERDQRREMMQGQSLMQQQMMMQGQTLMQQQQIMQQQQQQQMGMGGKAYYQGQGGVSPGGYGGQAQQGGNQYYQGRN